MPGKLIDLGYPLSKLIRSIRLESFSSEWNALLGSLGDGSQINKETGIIILWIIL